MIAAAIAVIGALLIGLSLGLALGDERASERARRGLTADAVARALLRDLEEQAAWLEDRAYDTEAQRLRATARRRAKLVFDHEPVAAIADEDG